MVLQFPVLHYNLLLPPPEDRAHQNEAALATPQIPEIETTDICKEHTVKQTPKPNRSKSSAARVINNLEGDRLREEYVAKEEEKRQREAARAARGGWGGFRSGGRMRRRGGAVIGSEEAAEKAS